MMHCGRISNFFAGVVPVIRNLPHRALQVLLLLFLIRPQFPEDSGYDIDRQQLISTPDQDRPPDHHPLHS